MRKIYVAPSVVKVQNLSSITAEPLAPVVSGAAPVG